MLNDEERMNVLQTYTPIDLASKGVLDSEGLRLIRNKITYGIIDSNGIYHGLFRKDCNEQFFHGELMEIVQKNNNEVGDYFIRIVSNSSELIFTAASSKQPNENDLTDFHLTKEMAVALYNGIMSITSPRMVFEERLIKYGEFGYNANGLELRSLIYNSRVFNGFLNDLSFNLRDYFDKQYFLDLLKENEIEG